VPLNPQLQPLLDAIAHTPGPPPEQLSVEDNRRLIRELATMAERPEVGDVADRMVPTPAGPVPVRLYRPSSGRDNTPLLVWFHGGGFVIGDLETADPTARDLCAGAEVVVASVGYPLAPEHPFPAAPEACWAATAWLADHAGELGADPSRLAVGGDSAGGNLAAVTCLLARDRGGPAVAFQLLVYPVTDLLGSYPSVRENGEGYLLTRAMMDWFHGHYLGDPADGDNPLASPIYARDLVGLPAALVITAELDPLRDEGEAYGERLRLAGTKVTVSRYEGMIHGFLSMTATVDGARQAMAEAVAALRTALA
jgi:acetyl esterase